MSVQIAAPVAHSVSQLRQVSNQDPLCDHHHEVVALPLSEQINAKSQALEATIARTLLETCDVTFNQTNRRSPFFEISGPEEVIEHGKVYIHPFQPMPKIFRRFQKKGPSYVLSKAEIEDSGALGMIVKPIIQDISFQEWHTALYGTSYLCDNPTHMALVSSVNSDVFAANSAAFTNGLTGC